jgi:flagellar hook-basal body complex protein FliE
MINGVGMNGINTDQYKVGFNNVEANPQSVKGGVDLTKTFGEFLTDAFNGMNTQRAYVTDLQQKFITGEMPDVHRLMIEAEKSSIATALTIQIRNKVVEAYQEVMRTQI